MAFTAVYDACVLYPVSLRDLFIRLGQTGLFRAKWTERIIDEFVDALLEKRPDLKDSLERQRELMRNAIRDVDVRDYARLIPVVPQLPDVDDAHVVAAAMACGAEVIVTFNLGDFPDDVLKRLGIEAQHPDSFVMHLIDLDRGAIEAVIEAMSANRKDPPMTYDEILDTLHVRGLPRSAAELRRK
jgi:PIN domain-containing protein